MQTFRFPHLPVREVVFAQECILVPKRSRALASSGRHHVVAGSLSSIDVKNLTCHKTSAIEVEHRVYNVGHISHPTHWMERRQRLMRFWWVHRRLDYSR